MLKTYFLNTVKKKLKTSAKEYLVYLYNNEKKTFTTQ